MTAPLQFTFTGPVTINQVDFEPVFTRLNALEDHMATEAEQITALTAKVEAFDTEVGDADGSDTPPTP